MPRKTARDKAVDTAIRAMYGSQGPDDDINVAAIRQILGAVFDAGAAASCPRHGGPCAVFTEGA